MLTFMHTPTNEIQLLHVQTLVIYVNIPYFVAEYFAKE